MGLDITAYINAKPTTADNEDSISCLNAKGFISRGGDLPEGYYLADPEVSFRAGSYSGYNAWRDTLCKTIHKMSAYEFWNSPLAETDAPFAELINFTDCDGYLGTSVCKKLATDFGKYRVELEAKGDELWNLYGWIEVFEQAANNNGFVKFH